MKFTPPLPPSSFRPSLRSLVSRTADQTESDVVEPVVRVVVVDAGGNSGVAGADDPATATNAATGLTKPNDGSRWILQFNSGSAQRFYALSQPLALKAGAITRRRWRALRSSTTRAALR